MRLKTLIPSPYSYWITNRILVLLAWSSMPCSLLASIAISSWWPFLAPFILVPLILNPQTRGWFGGSSFSVYINLGLSTNTIWDRIASRLGLKECPNCNRSIFSAYPDGDYNSATLVPYYGTETEPLKKNLTLRFWPQPFCVQCGYDFTVRRHPV